MQEYTNDHPFNVSIFNVADLLCGILPIAFFQHPLCTTVERIQSFKLYRWIISWWQVTNFEIALSRVIWFALLPRHFFFFFLGPWDLSCAGKNCFGIRPLRLRWFVTQRKKICSVVNYEISFCPTILRQVPSVAKETTAGDIYFFSPRNI